MRSGVTPSTSFGRDTISGVTPREKPRDLASRPGVTDNSDIGRHTESDNDDTIAFFSNMSVTFTSDEVAAISVAVEDNHE